MLDEAAIRKVLVVVAHPDDIDFGGAGTIAKLTDAGAEVVYCLVTDGEAGWPDHETPAEKIAATRRAEQTAAAKCVGVSDLRWLGYPDGAVEYSLELRRAITRVIRQVRPDLVITSTPERNYAAIGPSHPDHRAVGAATLDAVYPDARNPRAFPELITEEGLEPWTVREVWLSGTMTPNRYVDVTATVERKIAALRAHESQTSHIPDLAGMVKGWLSANARAAGLPEGSFAEAFHAVVTA
ncbi:GlcNAc-PI de-N-acetylase [Thermobispora bispora]|jgi:LmbE family N-acetylglucosaminyl deacetylase|uniref:LmbE family protein n=1 Tax=Thermobispora bispora (strain ATCC 19993 / DSM 43833 / CBS 139.67 / JCM 10125 / KCTC 9307 / NBRC 14880 / R51) TaxID=469371 RepID=D6Y5N0_THEBD|nr:PIG-L deacetylase family protein [Thermobispora bispora]MBO2472717.1 PIG-L family deacetylase [Actinomycetales bacterium]MDI9580752.1 PIG-L deacetylase family protein [Thermobispora sp.]ADG87376.1 LmbE family protein [Thermobispora bispora DSM 43833]MBX6167345.1 PIG-L family deacetylase [Thermobispora bispora]QSI47321.1 PIG-L family deacetylase [Thermobispora bispora]